MRTNIVIDPKIMASAMKASGAKTKKRAVEEGLRLLAAQSDRGYHPAYAAWVTYRARFTRAGQRGGSAGERTSDPMKAALDAKYRP